MTDFNLGTFDPSISQTPKLTKHFVDSSNTRDVFKFFLSSDSNLNVALTKMSKDADVWVYEDSDNNGLFDTSDQLIRQSTREGNQDDSINLAIVGGNNAYFAVVEGAEGNNNTKYELRISATYSTDPSNLLPTEVNVGTLKGIRTFDSSELVGSLSDGNDTADVYRFRVTKSAHFLDIDLSGITDLEAAVGVRLIRDLNGNKVVNAKEVLQDVSFLGGSSMDTINNVNLKAGTDYFVQVYNTDGLASDYILALNAHN